MAEGGASLARPVAGVPEGTAGISDASSVLTVQVEGQKPLIFTVSAFARLPRQTVRARDHSGMEFNFAGVLLRDLLTQAGEPLGEALAKDRLTTVVLVAKADGHRLASVWRNWTPVTATRRCLWPTKWRD